MAAHDGTTDRPDTPLNPDTGLPQEPQTDSSGGETREQSEEITERMTGEDYDPVI